jgi:D-3-phosphoglycerate dehydrogenase / 2-oxoglutarate reductase
MNNITVLCTTDSFIARKFPDQLNVIYNPYKKRLSEEEVIKLVIKYQPDAIIAGLEPISRKVMKEATRLRLISRCGVGLDNVDLVASEEMGIKVYNTPDAPVQPVAELAIAMMFALARNLFKQDSNTKKGIWEKTNASLLSEMTIGIIGCGRIGMRVASILHETGCNILGYDINDIPLKYFKKTSFIDLLNRSDIISLHLPLTPQSYHIIGRDEILKMKSGAILINTSRGGLIDEKALYEFLENGHLSGAGLDVFEDEPYNGPLCGLDNVILTPHAGSSAGGARLRMEEESVRNLLTGLKELSLI